MSVFATISGILITGRVSSGSATNGIEYHMDAIASTVIGGVSMTGGSGNVMGVVGGVLIMGAKRPGFNDGITVFAADFQGRHYSNSSGGRQHEEQKVEG